MNNNLLRVFETESDYDSAKPDFVYPTVSYVRDVDEVRYMDESLRNYFFIEALADGMTVALNNTSQSINAPANELEYSTDQQVWRRLPNNIASTRVNAGERIYLRGTATSAYDEENGMAGMGFFNISQSCNVGGNIMSLLFNDDFEDKTDLTGYVAAFAGLFMEQPIVNASELLLPATTLSMACYGTMFLGCTSLTTAPALPALILCEGCYSLMFLGCSNLNYIKMLATDVSAGSYLSGWVSGVSATGTFVKNPALLEDTIGRGASGIPVGWTVDDYVAPGTYLPEYDTTGLATHFIPDEYYANVIPLFQQIYNQYGDNVEILTDTQTLQYENGETVQIYVGDEPLYQNYLSKLTYNVNEIEFSVKRICIPTFGKEVWMSDGDALNWFVLINMTNGQCTKMRME